ncbi:DUF262 domain-containing protein [Mesobacillus subterraneus]|uniref:DUF262 domain-containing protein n=1 Tax=Mesobacillus subterraneus TaxID=285983 RepID=UPI001CFD6A41|nr:DUF262 domain-containing protein [Mesobacillus subterraneus]WLR54613.1 DUF262 domain-containing protein [Mesobacillus subterraneus]
MIEKHYDQEQEELFERIHNEENEEADEEIYDIKSWGADLSFRELIMMFDDDDLIKPEIQRNYVWDKTMASRFIESILMGLPVPSIFLSKMKNDKYLIIDGFQRFMTVYDFVKGLFNDQTPFKLTNSKKIQPKWAGKSFIELSEDDKRKIKTTTIHAIIFDHKDDASLFQIFERINTGGRSLSSQEIRNCLYHNEMNKLLLQLNQNKDWRYIYGNDKYDRMTDVEHILRFFAFKSDDVKSKMSGQLLLKRYLSEFMGDERIYKNEKILMEYKEEFDKVIKYIRKNFNKEIFKARNSFKSPIFDSIAIATAHALSVNKDLEDISQDKIDSLLKDEDFNTYTTLRTTNYEHINKRINIAANKLYGLKYLNE